MACTSRSYWESSSSCGNEVVPKTATGRHRRSAKTTFRPRLFQATKSPSSATRPIPSGWEFRTTDLGVSVHPHWLVGTRRHRDCQLVEQAHRLLRLELGQALLPGGARPGPPSEAPEADAVVVGRRPLLGHAGRIAGCAAQSAGVRPGPDVGRTVPADGDRRRSLLHGDVGQPGVDPDDPATRREGVDGRPGARERQRGDGERGRGLPPRASGSPAGRRSGGPAAPRGTPTWRPARPWRDRRSRSRGARCGRARAPARREAAPGPRSRPRCRSHGRSGRGSG